MNLVDFRGAAEAAHLSLNRWIEDKSARKIRELIPWGFLNAYTRLVLVNVVYFKGMWVTPFSKADTRDQPFELESGATVQVPLMMDCQRVGYLQGDGYQAIDLVYRGDDLSMLVLLSAKSDGLGNLEKRLSTRMLHECVTQLHERRVMILLPRFTISWGPVDVRDQLRALGMTLAFDPAEADYSGINGDARPHEAGLFISDVLHQARVEVNEEGTVAAAATSVMVTLGSAPPVFRADHPFLFVIRERKTGAILFLGRVADPTRTS